MAAWPAFAWSKARRRKHWRWRGTTFFSHAGCFLSAHRVSGNVMADIYPGLRDQPLTVLVTHWWEFFPENRPHQEMIRQLHLLADFLGRTPGMKVRTFEDVAEGKFSPASLRFVE